jgi:predicted membrane protein
MGTIEFLINYTKETSKMEEVHDVNLGKQLYMYLAKNLINNIMNTFLRFCSIISIIIASVKLAIIGNLTPGVVVFIIICCLIIILGNKKIYIIGASVAALVLFIKVYGGGSLFGEFSLLKSVLTLALVVFGLYIMLRGFLPGRRNEKQSRK